MNFDVRIERTTRPCFGYWQTQGYFGIAVLFSAARLVGLLDAKSSDEMLLISSDAVMFFLCETVYYTVSASVSLV